MTTTTEPSQDWQQCPICRIDNPWDWPHEAAQWHDLHRDWRDRVSAKQAAELVQLANDVDERKAAFQDTWKARDAALERLPEEQVLQAAQADLGVAREFAGRLAGDILGRLTGECPVRRPASPR